MVRKKQMRFSWQILPLTLLVVVGMFLIGCAEKKPKLYKVGILNNIPFHKQFHPIS